MTSSRDRRRHLRLGRHPDRLARHRLPRRVPALAQRWWRRPRRTTTTTGTPRRCHQAGATVWGWSRDEQRSATVADLFEVAGLGHDPELLTAYYDFWEPHTLTDPQVGPMWTALKEQGIKVGVLSNTLWARERHRGWFERDGVLDLIDGDVYTSEIPWTKPSPKAFGAAMAGLGLTDPSRCVYVGDRLFDDVWGAHNAGLRAIHIPHSVIPAEQVGHTEGVPDAVAHELSEIPDLVAGL